MNGYAISLFGDLGVTYEGTAVPVTGTRQRSLLALLAIHANLTLSPDRIIEELWGDEPPSGPINALRFNLSKLRTQLTHEDGDRNALIDTQPGGYCMTIDPEDVDTMRYAGLINRAETLLGIDPQAALEVVDEAERLVTGPPLNEFRYDDFARGFAARMDLLLRRGRSVSIDIAIALADDEGALDRISTALEDDPYDESLYRRLMLVHYRSGRSRQALATYKQATTRLGEDLGLEPSPELAELEEQILLHTVEPSSSAPSGGLPAEVTSLIGRSEEMRQAAELLQANRWVALTGLPGAGKSRIALRIAHEAPLAVWFEVPETEERSELRTGLRSAIQRSFPHVNVDPTDPLSALGGLESLVVFDGLDRSRAAADLIGEALTASPSVSVLTTTRAPSAQNDERSLTIPPLNDTAVRELMRERLGRDPDASVAELLEATGGLPGMIEVAAIAERIGGSGVAGAGSFAEDALSGASPSIQAAVPKLCLLQPPFDVIDAGIAVGGKAEAALDGLSGLVASGIVLTIDAGLAVHPLLRSQVLDSFAAGSNWFDLDPLLDFIANNAERIDLSNRAILRVLDAADDPSRQAGLDDALAALVLAWWNRGPQRGHADLLRPDVWSSLDAEDPRTAHLLSLATHMCLADNDVPRAVEFVHRHADATESGGPSAQSRHDQLLGHLALFTGDLPSAIEALKRGARTAIDADAPGAAAIVASLGFVELAASSGSLEGHSDRVLLTGRSQPLAQALADELDGYAAWMLGDLDTADIRLSEAVRGYRDIGRQAWATPTTALLATVACHRSDPDRAAALLAGEKDDGSPVLAAAQALVAAHQGDANTTEHALSNGARSLADGTNPIWTYRLLTAAMHAATVSPDLRYDGEAMASAAARLASTVGLRMPATDAGVMPAAGQDVTSPAPALAILRSL